MIERDEYVWRCTKNTQPDFFIYFHLLLPLSLTLLLSLYLPFPSSPYPSFPLSLSLPPSHSPLSSSLLGSSDKLMCWLSFSYHLHFGKQQEANHWVYAHTTRHLLSTTKFRWKKRLEPFEDIFFLLQRCEICFEKIVHFQICLPTPTKYNRSTSEGKWI